MKKSEKIQASVTELREKLKEKEKLLRQAKRDEEREQARLEYQKKVEEALKLLELSKITFVEVNHQQITVYNYLKNRIQP